MKNIVNVINLPKVSVIIPTYGGSNSLKRAIESVLEQNYGNFNIIVVDDNDPMTQARKQTEKIMKHFEGNSQVIYIKHDKNKNASAARNTGVKATDAKYLCLLDDDDLFLKNRIVHQVDFLEKHTEFQACYCWRIQNGKMICGIEEGDLTKSLLDLSFTPTTSAIMLTKNSYDSLNGFDETYRRHQDYEFLIRFFKKFKMGVVPEVLLRFEGNEVDNQLYGKKLYELKKHFFSQFKDEIELIESNNTGYKKRVYASHFATACIQLLKKGDFFLALKMYFEYGVEGGLLFWSIFFSKTVSGVFRKFKNLIK